MKSSFAVIALLSAPSSSAGGGAMMHFNHGPPETSHCIGSIYFHICKPHSSHRETEESEHEYACSIESSSAPASKQLEIRLANEGARILAKHEGAWEAFEHSERDSSQERAVYLLDRPRPVGDIDQLALTSMKDEADGRVSLKVSWNHFDETVSCEAPRK